MEPIPIPVAPGELIDKITILEIKSERITDATKLANIRHELEQLLGIWNVAAAEPGMPDITPSRNRLRQINEQLWDIEDHIREREAADDFGQRFVELARAVYLTNDQRAAVKRQINQQLGSELIEEKSYQSY